MGRGLLSQQLRLIAPPELDGVIGLIPPAALDVAKILTPLAGSARWACRRCLHHSQSPVEDRDGPQHHCLGDCLFVAEGRFADL